MSEAQEDFYWALADGDMPAALRLLEAGDVALAAFDWAHPAAGVRPDRPVALALLLWGKDVGDTRDDVEKLFAHIARAGIDFFAPTPPEASAFVVFSRAPGEDRRLYGATGSLGSPHVTLTLGHLSIVRALVDRVFAGDFNAAADMLRPLGLTSARVQEYKARRESMQSQLHGLSGYLYQEYLDELLCNLTVYERSTTAESAAGCLQTRTSPRRAL